MLKPIGNKLVIKFDEISNVTASGIVLATASKEKSSTGTVVEKGPGRRLENGNMAGIAAEIGDRIIFSQYAGVEVIHEGIVYMIISEQDILAIVQ